MEIASQQDDEVLRGFMKMYANKSRPFCVPQFLPFDRKRSSHRVADQIFSGFPFTCAEFPWPIEKIGNHMQPIAQINLAMASELLSENLGSGLMQIWGGVDSGTKVELLSRLIPESALTSEPDWFYPEHAPWLDRALGYEGCAHSSIDVSDFPSFGIDNCRVEWRLLGQMFYPSVMDLVCQPHGADRANLEKNNLTSIYGFDVESIEEKLESACISRPSSILAAWGERPLVLLGGYPESLGNAWGTYQDDLLFYHSLDYAVMMSIGLTYKSGGDGIPQFSVNWTCNK